MLHARRGFTLIEISLFLAITAVIFAGIVAGTQNSIYWQRYNDSVQSFAEFLRAEYSRVANVQNSTGTGKSGEIIYGRLIDFSNPTNIKSYSVIGKELNEVLSNSKILDQLADAQVTVDGRGLDESFTPRWGSAIQQQNGYSLFQGAILIVRHPETGTIYTYVDNYYDSSKALYELLGPADPSEGKPFKNNAELILCVNPEGNVTSDSRRAVTIAANAHNASGIVASGDCATPESEP